MQSAGITIRLNFPVYCVGDTCCNNCVVHQFLYDVVNFVLQSTGSDNNNELLSVARDCSCAWSSCPHNSARLYKYRQTCKAEGIHMQEH